MKIKIREKVTRGEDVLLPGEEYEAEPNEISQGVFIKLKNGRWIYLSPWQFTYIG